MSELKRYALSSAGRVFPDSDGNWVFHESARAALDSLKAQLATEREAHARTLAALEWALDELEAHGLDPDEWSQDAVTARWRGEEKARAAIAAAKVTP